MLYIYSSFSTSEDHLSDENSDDNDDDDDEDDDDDHISSRLTNVAPKRYVI